jgi:hypothetical protein
MRVVRMMVVRESEGNVLSRQGNVDIDCGPGVI